MGPTVPWAEWVSKEPFHGSSYHGSINPFLNPSLDCRRFKSPINPELNEKETALPMTTVSHPSKTEVTVTAYGAQWVLPHRSNSVPGAISGLSFQISLLPEFRYMQKTEEAMLNVCWSEVTQLKVFFRQHPLITLFSFQPHSEDGQNKTELAEGVIKEALWTTTTQKSFPCEEGGGSTCRPTREHPGLNTENEVLEPPFLVVITN